MGRTIGLACDHAGFTLKEIIKNHLLSRNFNYEDFGTFNDERCDYPDYAHRLGASIEQGLLEMGIAICGTGNGMAFTLNKYPNLRACIAWNRDVAQLVSAHNKANILVLPARFISNDAAIASVDAYLDTPFEGGRHAERIEKALILNTFS